MKSQSKRPAALAIIQLCFAFSLLLWQASQPFMGDYFAVRSQMLLHEYVMGTAPTFKTAEEQAARQAERFDSLPTKQREKILGDYHVLQQHVSRPFFDKIREGLYALLFETPVFELAWIAFAITISILILLKREGAARAAWLLPLIVIGYGIDSQLYGRSAVPAPDTVLFPTEKMLVEDYLQAPLSNHVPEQQTQLQHGWNQYLQKNWAEDATSHADEEALFNFTIARLKLWHQHPAKYAGVDPHEKSGSVALLAYFLWNLLFAWKTQERVGRSKEIML